MVGLTVVAMAVIVIAIIVMALEIKDMEMQAERLENVCISLSASMAKMKGERSPLQEHVLREAGLRPKNQQKDFAGHPPLATSSPETLKSFSYDDELDAALKQCAVEE